MRAQLLNTVEHTITWLNRGTRSPLSQIGACPQLSTVSSSYAPLNSTRDSAVRRQRETDALKPSQQATTESSKSDSSVAGIIRLMAAKKPTVGQKAGTYADGLRVRQEESYQAYNNRAPPYNLHVYAHKHNTIITLTRPNGNPIMSLGCGNIGFRKSHRSGYDPAYQLSSHVFAQIQERGLLHEIKGITLVFKGFGMGREAFIKVLLGNEGRNVRPLVTRVTDNTTIKFGGTRSRHVRRLG